MSVPIDPLTVPDQPPHSMSITWVVTGGWKFAQKSDTIGFVRLITSPDQLVQFANTLDIVLRRNSTPLASCR
jgi:hypothetical protein